MSLKDYFSILRPIDGFMAVIAVLVGYTIVLGEIILTQQLFLGMIAVFLFSGAGVILNDFFDFEIDKVNAPKRPLPSGRISRNIALQYSVILFFIALAIASAINSLCFGLAVLNTFLEILYAWKLKKIALIGNFIDSWFPASSFLFGAMIVAPSFVIVGFLALLAFLANTGREIFGDLEDIKGDRKLNLKTLPILIGEKKSKSLAQVFIVLAVLLSFVPFYLNLLNLNYLIIIVLADIVFIVSLFQKPSTNQALTKGAMVLALIAFLVGILG